MLHLFGTRVNHLAIMQHYAARFGANDHRIITIPSSLVLTINWQTLERRRIIKQATTFDKILNWHNLIEITPPPHPCIRAYSHDHTTATITVPRSILNTVGLLIHFTPSHPFHRPNTSKKLVTKPQSGTQHHILVGLEQHFLQQSCFV